MSIVWISTSRCEQLRVKDVPLSTQEAGLMNNQPISNLQTPSCHITAELFQRRCTMTSFSNSIKGGAHLNLGHFLLVSQCTSLLEVSEHISSGKGAFPSIASASIVEAILLLIYLK